MKIKEIYKNYKILPNLQLHQRRVAAVAKYICDNTTVPLDTQKIITACLLHDMGNIIKFKLDVFPEFLKNEGYDYWKQIQEGFINKYGTDEHDAHIKIAQELGVSNNIIDLIDSVGFTQAKIHIKTNDLNKKIVCYSDQRVGPFGVLSLEERVREGGTRVVNGIDSVKVQENTAALFELEKQIFGTCKITPEDINDESLKDILKDLEEFDIQN